MCQNPTTMSNRRKQQSKKRSTNNNNTRSSSTSNGHGADHSENSYMSNGSLDKEHSNYDSATKVKPSSPSTTTTKSPLMGILLLSVFVFGMGALGILYVGWVQYEYGYGKNASMEQQLLPFGPLTSHATKQRQDEIGSGDDNSQQRRVSSRKKKKSIILNKDHPNPQTSWLPTMYGLDFNNHVMVQVQHPDESDYDHPHHQTMKRRRNDYDVDPDWYQLSYTRSVSIVASEKDMIQQVAIKMHQHVLNLHERTAQVSWGGPKYPAHHETNWWYPAGNNSVAETRVDLDVMDGGHLLYGYLFIMKWNTNPKFPFRLCAADGGCPPERAILHTLEWREKYKPWLVPPSLLKENAKGYVFHRGFSPETFEAAGRHGTVWVRVGHQVKNDLAFFRGILNAADRAIAASLVQSNGQVGKFNVIFDCTGFSLSNTPSLQSLKQAVTMLQDHFPNRLGMIFLAHISRPGEMFLRVVLRLITKEVRDKVKILPTQDQQKSLAILRMIVEEDHIPDWLGGPDEYRFHVDDYYPHYLHCTEEEAQEFITTMPYHAI